MLLQGRPAAVRDRGRGAGKSIFTRRLEAFLCSPEGRRALFDGKPALVVRWEERTRAWPASFTPAGLIAALPRCRETVAATASNVTAAEAAEWALQTGPGGS